MIPWEDQKSRRIAMDSERGDNADGDDMSMVTQKEKDTDMRMLQAWLSGVDITEVFSPVRVAEVARHLKMSPGTSFDLTNGWDFEKDDHKRAAWKRIKRRRS